MKVYVLYWESYEQCHHHGIWATPEGAMAEAQRVDNEWCPYPDWDKNLDGTPDEHIAPIGPLSWRSQTTESGEVRWTADGFGYARWWHIDAEEVR